MNNKIIQNRKRVILIGGAPFSGKTTLARSLARKIRYDCISTDDIRMALTAVTTRRSHPGLHILSGKDYWEYYRVTPVEVLIADAELQHRSTWPALEAVIMAHASWSSPAIIEGWGLLPSMVNTLCLDNISSLWLIVSEEVLRERITSQKEFYRGASDKTGMIQGFLNRGISFNKRVRKEVISSGLASLQVTLETTEEELLDSCLELV